MGTDDGEPRRWILYLVPMAPRLDAVNGGARVTAQLIAHMAQRHHVAVMYIRAAHELSMDTDLQNMCEMVHETIVPVRWTGRFADVYERITVLMLLARGFPLWAINRRAASFGRRVAMVVAAWQPDVVQFEYHVMGQYARILRGTHGIKILTQHEPGMPAAQNVRQEVRGRGRWMARIDSLVWRRFESRVIRDMDAVVVFSERDRQATLMLAPSASVVVIPFGTDIPTVPLNPAGRNPATILFVGNYSHPPNRAAATRLLTAIFPSIRAQYGEVVLQLVGDGAPSEFEAMAGAGVEICGRVPDVVPYLDRAAVVVAPIHTGGGQRVKVLEALAAGKAVVATPLAAEGLTFVADPPLVLADTDEHFSDAVLALLLDVDRRVDLAGRARRWSEEYASWSRPVAAYERLYTDLLSPGKAPPS